LIFAGRIGQPIKRSTRSYCYNCNTKRTPQWRNGPHGERTLCNACGLKYRKGALPRCEYYSVHVLGEKPEPPDPVPVTGLLSGDPVPGGSSGGSEEDTAVHFHPVAESRSLLSHNPSEANDQSVNTSPNALTEDQRHSNDGNEQIPSSVVAELGKDPQVGADSQLLQVHSATGEAQLPGERSQPEILASGQAERLPPSTAQNEVIDIPAW
jgi:GATA zinc finger